MRTYLYNEAMEKGKKVFLILGIVFLSIALFTNGFIIYQSCLQGAESTGWSDPVTKVAADIVNGIKSNTINDSNILPFSGFIRKAIGHFGLFGFDSVVSTLGAYFIFAYFHKAKDWLIGVISGGLGLVMALLTELIQHFVPGRSGDIIDSLIDFAGYALALIIVALIISLILRKRKQKKA